MCKSDKCGKSGKLALAAHCSRSRDEVRAPIIASLFLNSGRPRPFCIRRKEKGTGEGGEGAALAKSLLKRPPGLLTINIYTLLPKRWIIWTLCSIVKSKCGGKNMHEV